MRKFLIAALASTAIATPAFALDNAMYVGIEGGVLYAEDTELDYETTLLDVDDAVILDHNTGFDVDLIGGYDFGGVRAEAELAYKRASVDQVRLNTQITPPGSATSFEGDGRVSVLSAMANVLLDFGEDGGWNGYLGGGAGYARVKYNADANGITPAFGFNGSDSGFAWQAIAGVRTAISPNMDIGLKYRFFNMRKVEFDGVTGGTAPVGYDLQGRFRTHSLLASLIFNFAPPPPPPPPPPPVEAPPPPPPATQTCPDGSVILATDTCPLPPPPPPPPPPEPVRG